MKAGDVFSLPTFGDRHKTKVPRARFQVEAVSYGIVFARAFSGKGLGRRYSFILDKLTDVVVESRA